MIDYPKLKKLPSSRKMLDVFKGYNRNLRIKEGEFRDMENLGSDCYPALSVRKPRSVYRSAGQIDAVFVSDDGLTYTADGALHMPLGGTILNFYQGGELQWQQQLIPFGKYIILQPDMMWVDTKVKSWETVNGTMEPLYDYGSMNAEWETDTDTVTFELCQADGTVYENVVASDTQPASPKDKTLWINTSVQPRMIKLYSTAYAQWIDVDTTYVRISSENLDIVNLSRYDGVRISGVHSEKLEAMNGVHGIWQTGQGDHCNFLVVEGILDEKVTQDCATEGKIRIERTAPKMNYVIEAGNRLWGCRYGVNNDGKFVNKIYASKLGDFKNWNCFMGIATDSWVAEVGSGGAFTGAANVGGYPVFYKENVKYKVWISDTGAHQITETPCQGVKEGCGGSVAGINGAAVYKSRRGFCIDDGGLPDEFGQELAGEDYGDAVGCVLFNKYYVSMQDKNSKWHLFVYDFEKKLWHREEGFHVRSICSNGRNSVFAVDADTNTIVDLLGRAGVQSSAAVKWYAETGEIGLDSPDRKYISRLTLRLSMEPGAELTIYAQYDMEPEWVALGSIRGTSLQTFSLPVRPRRCDHLRLRLEGEGNVKLYSITKTIEEGSEFP